MNRLHSIARLVWAYLGLVGRRFIDDGCYQSAAALTYVSLFAVVPMMTVTFSMFTLVPAFNDVGLQVREMIFDNFLPSAGLEIQSYLEQFSTQARRLSLVGVGILVVTAYMMLRNIERVFNRIWKTPGPRRGVSAFLLYWAMLSMGPFLLGAALLMSTYLLSVRLFEGDLGANAISLVFGYLPWLLTALAFTLMYIVVPNCKVAFRNAVTGGLVAAIAFEVAKTGFGYFVANSAYTSIYGAFATLPIFLVWVYVSWMIVLGGAEFVRATENFRAESKQPLPHRMAAVYALWLFWDAQRQGREVSDSLCRKAGMTSDQWSAIRDDFLRHKIISVAESGNYLLLRSLNTLKLSDLNHLMQNLVTEDLNMPGTVQSEEAYEWWKQYSSLVRQDQQKSDQLFDVTLEQLFIAGQESSGAN